MNVPEASACSTGTRKATDDLPWIEDGKVAPKDARVLSRLFLDRLQVLEEGTREYQYARNTLIEMNLSLVAFAARRFSNRDSGDMEDIIQGEIKRFFRDTTWAVHVPRRLQELRVSLARSREALAISLNRAPTVRELGAHLDLTDDEVIEGLVAANGYVASSIDEMRFGQEMTQAEIGRELHLSHMHISRLLTRTLTKLRIGLLPS
ncbi:sigma factor-like helix-turn-helix DNA-binding protein [Streptomyces sp. NPDC008343]|uniref:sigma factor-like helix-turn-helix DNA-binding protein n=1 Tax=Streptomyces sp. NPDC008343 TaxID=3364828 RepID=UPI0036E6BDE8